MRHQDVVPAGIAELRRRWSRVATERLRVPLGVDEHGGPVALDLKESALGGSGPHGLCIGATGSGKSELLRTLVLGLVATHPPTELNLVLVDFKGGATFLGMSGLPHTAAVITNLADELTLVDRMADALAGEITRRQEILRAAGNLSGVNDYAAARRAGADLPPLPALFVVVDEFSELLSQRPELLDLMVMIGRLGRSLGLHLLLASQRLDEGRLRGLESHLSYQIALRTFSAAESRAVLGVPDAHQLPSAPGSAFLSTGTDELIRFRSAYVSGPSVAPPGPAGPAARRPCAYPFGIAPVPLPPDDPTPAPSPRRRLGGADRVRDRRGRAGRGRAGRAPRLAAPARRAAAARRARRAPRRAGAAAGAASGWSTGPTTSAGIRCWSTWPARPVISPSSADRGPASPPPWRRCCWRWPARTRRSRSAPT